jgi:hypothetical protein
MKTTFNTFLLALIFIGCQSAREPVTPTEEVIQEETPVKKESEPAPVEVEPIESRMSKDFLHGVWQNLNHKDIDFILHINIVDDLVLGEYCSKAKNFFLEDCALEDEGGYCMIRGDVNAFNVELMMESCLNAEVAEAFLRRENAELLLILDKPAGEYGKDHLVPDTVQLKKIANEPYF